MKEAVAFRTYDETGREFSKAIVPMPAEVAERVERALVGHVGIEAIPCRRQFDVFGKSFWVDASAPGA
jgi:hypothetical protein